MLFRRRATCIFDRDQNFNLKDLCILASAAITLITQSVFMSHITFEFNVFYTYLLVNLSFLFKNIPTPGHIPGEGRSEVCRCHVAIITVAESAVVEHL